MNVFYRTEDEDTLVQNNIPLVVSIALKYHPNPPYDHDDLISVGMIGLLRAIRAFDPSYGEFSTLAYKVISNEIIRELVKTNPKAKVENSDFDIEDKSEISIDDYFPENLNEKEKQILYLRFHLNHTYEEIGEKLGHTKQWAFNKLNAVLNKIKLSNEQKKKEDTTG
jgi:RNA polymerase sigma factor (sigma-70 family)